MEGAFLVVKKVIPFLLGMIVSRRLVAVVAVWALCLILAQSSMAGLFGTSLPKGKEVEDPELLRLFEPEFPYESTRVVETEEGKCCVVVKAKEKITPEERIAYELKTLHGRGVFIHREWSPRSGNLMLAEMRSYRKVSDVPFVVEYSEVMGEKLRAQLASPSEDVVRRDERYLVVFVSRDFGKPRVRLMVCPEEDASCPDPPFVGRYPNSRKLSCREKDGKMLFLLVTKDRPEDVYAWYRDRLLEHYEQMGVDYPERRWEYGEPGYGIKKTAVSIGDLKEDICVPRSALEFSRAKLDYGFVSHIEIFPLMSQAIVGEYVVIEVSVT